MQPFMEDSVLGDTHNLRKCIETDVCSTFIATLINNIIYISFFFM